MHKGQYLGLLSAAILAGFLGGFCAARISQPTPALGAADKVVKAQVFEVIDPSGNKLLQIGPRAAITLYDRSGHSRVEFQSYAASGPSLTFSNQAGKGQLGIGFATTSTGEQIPAIFVADKKGKGRMNIELEKDGSPSIQLYKLDGSTWSAP
jgi:hypothetical protein